MTIRHLQIFRTVCDCGSITAAAERLNVTQPSVSLAIRELESFYGTRLFDRINRRIYLTEAGRTLRQYTEGLLTQFDEAAAVLRNGKAFTKCRLGTNASVAETALAGICSALREKIPALQLEIQVQNNEQIDRLLTDNRIDFAIYDALRDSGSREATRLFEDTMLAVCAPSLFEGKSMPLAALAGQPLLLREKGSGVRACVDAAFARHGCPQTVAAESISTLGLLQLAAGGMGFAVVPAAMAADACRALSLRAVRIEDEPFERTYYLVRNRKKHLTTALQAVAEVLENMG